MGAPEALTLLKPEAWAARIYENGRWTEPAVHGDEDIVRAPPFDAIEIALGAWWER